MPTVVVVLGAAMVAGSLAFLGWLATAERPVNEVRGNLSRGASRDSRQLALTASAKTRLFDPLFDAIAEAGRSFSGEGAARSTRRKLELAGLQEQGWTVERLLVVRVLSLGVGVVIGVIVLLDGFDRQALLIAGSAVAVAYMAPTAWLNRRAEQRQRLIERQLPDVIDQLTVSVEAGLGFDAAMQRSAEGRTGPLADELRRVQQDLALGVPRTEALERMVERTEVADLRQFVVAVRQSARHGLPIARILHVQSQELREKRRARVEEKAGSLPVKIVFPLVFCILPPLFVVILGPAMLDIADAF